MRERRVLRGILRSIPNFGSHPADVPRRLLCTRSFDHKKRSVGDDGRYHHGHRRLHLQPEDNPRRVNLPVVGIPTANLDNHRDNREDAQTQHRAQSKFSSQIDAHAPQKGNGNTDDWIVAPSEMK